MVESRGAPPPDRDLELFQSLMTKHQDQLYRTAYRMTGNPDDAEDLVQEVLVEAFRSFHRFQRGTYFDRWVYRIMSHTFIDRLRRKPKVALESLDEEHGGRDGDPYRREPADPGAGPEELALRRELGDKVQEALLRIPEEYRLVVALSDIEGLSYEEISRAVGCPIGTVRSRLHRGRSLMAQKLMPYVNERDHRKK
ncbi:MAG TPA: sigma-70 family RNA polymerase sigma factor [Armatimonadota bacterium]|jgi:RNA polymerase sigma-70 factor (ECF subfamily)